MLELLVEGNWTTITPDEITDKRYRDRVLRHCEPIHFDSEKYQYFIKKQGDSPRYAIYRIRRREAE